MTRASDTARLVSGGAVINEASNDVDFRVESNGNTHALFVDAGNDHVNINTSSDLGSDLNINGDVTIANANSGIIMVENAADAFGSNFTMRKSRNTTLNAHTVVQDDDVLGNINFQGSDGDEFVSAASISAAVNNTPGNNDMPGRLVFSTTTGGASSPTERMRIDGGGAVMIATTNNDVASTSGTGNEGHVFPVGAPAQHAISNSVCLDLNRKTSDGTIVNLRQNGTAEGTISVSGSTISYNGFSGLHESSGIATNTAIGTVVSTIDELDTYSTGTTKEGQTRADHAKVEVSDTVGDSAVYGVVTRFDENDKVFVASVGIGSVRVTGACAKGDLLESNGDGTAKVQSDDIVRSKTIGKVTIGNSNTEVKLVSCVLYCG